MVSTHRATRANSRVRSGYRNLVERDVVARPFSPRLLEDDEQQRHDDQKPDKAQSRGQAISVS